MAETTKHEERKKKQKGKAERRVFDTEDWSHIIPHLTCAIDLDLVFFALIRYHFPRWLFVFYTHDVV